MTPSFNSILGLTDTDKSGALKIAETIRARVEGLRILHSGSRVSSYVTLSIGVATAIPCQTSSMGYLISAADQSPYRAKESGRNRCGHEVEAQV